MYVILYSLRGIIFDKSTIAQDALICLHCIQFSQQHVRACLHKLVCSSKPTEKLARVVDH